VVGGGCGVPGRGVRRRRWIRRGAGRTASPTGEYRRGGDFPERKLPSRRELIEYYGVSPQTADRAVRELDARGLVIRIQGRGVFVKEPLPPPREA